MGSWREQMVDFLSRDSSLFHYTRRDLWVILMADSFRTIHAGEIASIHDFPFPLYPNNWRIPSYKYTVLHLRHNFYKNS